MRRLAASTPVALSTVGLLLLAAGPAGAQPPAAPDFSREVRPILARHCFKCHGPDDKARQSGLRLDLREAATGKSDSGEIGIVPGKPEASALIARITSADPDLVMPPPATRTAVSPAERETLRRWIAAGADYQPHWAFVAPRRPVVPQVEIAGEAAVHPIDAFLAARLRAAGLEFSPEADRATLVRRVYLDLIGLPPTPEEAEALLRDEAPQAYERLVERLLESPHYGERWARRWLDLARYADTNGYEKDRPRSIWPYRDWVIRALNADLSFDRFTIEQVAGDMLPDASLEQRTATGFHRNTMLNEEGGIDPLEFRFYAMTDRVATTGAAWLGLTLQCAQCHAHKFDPVSQLDYYRLMALLNNADEPELDLLTPEQQAETARRRAQAAALLAELPAHWPLPTAPGEAASPPEARRAASERAFAVWLEKLRPQSRAWQVLRPAAARSNLPRLEIEADGAVFASGDISKDDTYELEFAELPAGTTGLRLEALPDDRLPAHGPGLTYYEGPKGDFFLGEFELWAGAEKEKFTAAGHSYAKNHFGSSAVSAALALDGDPQTGWSCAGRFGEPHQATFTLGAPFPGGPATVKLRFGRHYACSLGRFRLSATTDPRGPSIPAHSAAVEDLLARNPAALDDAASQALREAFLLAAPELAKQAQPIRDLLKPPTAPTTLVLRERPADHPRPTHVHHRGEFLQPRDRVTPGVPAFLPPLPSGVSADRLALARWLVAPEQPLTARVVVNRHWAAFFGQGLVRTAADFGYQGEPPSHPELLDWLAVEFREQGWSLKKLCRWIVTSRAYRQASRITPDHLARDPENRLLARFPRVRLEAELIRDAALRASGLLSAKMFGPPVRPPQPAGVTEAAYGGGGWQVSGGEDRYRRGLYTFAKRTAPYAMFNTFDGPSGEFCVARREVSNTPLQALTLLNDEVLVEAAKKLGAFAATAAGDDAARIDATFRRCLTRLPSPAERDRLRTFLAAQRARLAAGELNAAELAGPGPGDAAERAAWTCLARALLNLDETITRN